jgi:hypothetical protein
MVKAVRRLRACLAGREKAAGFAKKSAMLRSGAEGVKEISGLEARVFAYS